MRTIFNILFISCLGLSLNLSAQDSIGFYINPKLGPTGWPDNWRQPGLPKTTDPGATVGVELGMIYKKNMFMTSFSYAGSLSWGGQENTPEQMKIIDISYGRYLGEGVFRFTYQAGAGIIYGKWWTYQQTVKFSDVCFPLEVGFRLLPSRFFGIGIDLLTNLNPKRIMFGGVLSLEFGKLR